MFDCVLLCAVCCVGYFTVECVGTPDPPLHTIPPNTNTCTSSQQSSIINHQSSVITVITSREQLLTTHEVSLKEVLKGDRIKASVCLISLKIPVPRSDFFWSAF